MYHYTSIYTTTMWPTSYVHMITYDKIYIHRYNHRKGQRQVIRGHTNMREVQSLATDQLQKGSWLQYWNGGFYHALPIWLRVRPFDTYKHSSQLHPALPGLSVFQYANGSPIFPSATGTAFLTWQKKTLQERFFAVGVIKGQTLNDRRYDLCRCLVGVCLTPGITDCQHPSATPDN